MMARVFCFLSFVLGLSPFLVSAQNNQIDSLTRILPSLSDTSQVNVLIQLFNAYRFTDRRQSFKYAERALAQSQGIGFEKGEMLAYQKIGIGYKDNNEYSRAMESYLNSLKIAERIGDWLIAAQDAVYLSGISAYLSDVDEALRYHKRALAYSIKSGDKKVEASMLSGVGENFKARKEFDSAIIYHKKSRDYFFELNDHKDIAMQNLHLGEVYDLLGHTPEALIYYDEAYGMYAEVKSNTGQGLVLNRKASIYLRQNKTTETIALLRKARQLNQSVHSRFHLIETLNLLVQAFRQQASYDSASSNLDRLISIAKASRLRKQLSEAYHLKAEISADQKDYKNAYYFHELHVRYYDSLFSEEKNKQIGELQLRLARESQAKEVALLKEEKFRSQVYLWLAIVVILALSIIAYLTINRQRIREKKNKELSEKEIQLMEEQQSVIELELRNKQLSEEQLRTQLDLKNKELTSYTLNIIHKNEMLEDVKAQIDQIKKLSDNELRTSLNSLMNTVKYSIHLDKDWDKFKLHFEQVHQGFFDKLKDNYPNLSIYDLRLCSLIKLNLETKQIAMLLDISTESAKVARSRLRKKMGLQTEQNLQEFLQAF